MPIIPIDVAMGHVYADSDDQSQVERKLASAIETAEQFMGRRIYENDDALAAAQVTATAQLQDVVLPVANHVFSDDDLSQVLNDVSRRRKYELVMQIRGVVINPAIEIGILLIFGDLYKNRENSVDGGVSELPMSALHHLEPFRFFGI